MKESMLSARIPVELEKELENYMKQEDVERSLAVRKLLKIAIKKWKLERALELLEKGEVSFTRAAGIAEMNIWSFADDVQKSGIVWIKDDAEKFRQELKRA